MQKKNLQFQQKLLAGNVRMDTQTVYHVNGDINIYPCQWEDEKQVTDGECVSYEGGIKVEPNGLTRVTRWKRGSKGPLHETLFQTAHGAVKMTRPQIRPSDGHRRINEEYIYVTFKFPKKYGLALTRALYEEEADEIMSYFKTRKEETVWSK